MMRKYILLFAVLFTIGNAVAEKGDPMMLWPILVQIDWDAYHSAAIENCTKKYPDYAKPFQSAIAEWSEKNMATILEIRGQIKEHLKKLEGLSEEEATAQMRKASATWTQQFLGIVSNTSDSSWKDICSGQYANETLRSMDFVTYRSLILPGIPSLRISQIRP